MKLIKLEVRNFRSIRHLEWVVGGITQCIIGPGDVGKSTVLDAIEFVLSSRYNLPFSDADFYQGEVSQPILIQATIGDLPPELLSDERLGLEKRGWSLAGDLNDEPEDGDEDVLTVQLTVDETLEPRWSVINERHSQGRPLSRRDRELLPVVRVGAEVDRHLSWGRGTALLKITANLNGVSSAFVEAARQVREIIEKQSFPALDDAASKVQSAAKALGVRLKGSLAPDIDASYWSSSGAAMSLHDGRVPLRYAGLGSRRLTVLAMQRIDLAPGTLVLVDEVEHALEPHRLLQLLKVLVGHRREKENAERPNQVVMTTHSPVVLRELPAENLARMTNTGESACIRQIGELFQGTVRKVQQDVLLAPSIVVCEGQTEFGFLRALEMNWEDQGGSSLAHSGVALLDGGGDSKSLGTAVGLAELGYRVCCFIDSDNESKWPRKDVEKLKASGVLLLTWDGGVAIEQRVCQDLTWSAIIRLVETARQLRGTGQVRGELVSYLKMLGSAEPADIGDIGSWLQSAAQSRMPGIRKAIGDVASAREWFKRVDYGEALGRVVASDLPNIKNTDLGMKLAQLRGWLNV